MMIIYAILNNCWLIPEMTIKLRVRERERGKEQLSRNYLENCQSLIKVGCDRNLGMDVTKDWKL